MTTVEDKPPPLNKDAIEAARQLLGTPLRRPRPRKRVASKDAIIEYTRAIGSRNPLYLQDTYASGTYYGSLVAHPTWLYCVDKHRRLREAARPPRDLRQRRLGVASPHPHRRLVRGRRQAHRHVGDEGRVLRQDGRPVGRGGVSKPARPVGRDCRHGGPAHAEGQRAGDGQVRGGGALQLFRGRHPAHLPGL